MAEFNVSTLRDSLTTLTTYAPIGYNNGSAGTPVPTSSNTGFTFLRVNCARTYTLRLSLEIKSTSSTTTQTYELVVRPTAGDTDGSSSALFAPCVPVISNTNLASATSATLVISIKVFKSYQLLRFRIGDAAAYTLYVQAQGTLDATADAGSLSFTAQSTADTGASSTANYVGSRGMGIRIDATNPAGIITTPAAIDSTSLRDTGVSAGTYGSTTACPVITVNAKGQITNMSTSPISSGTSTVLRIALLEYTMASGTPAALGTTGTIPLNTVAINDLSVALSNNQFTLPMGTYIMDTTVCLVNANRTRLLLRNVTDNAVLKWGTTTFSTDADVNLARLTHRFTLTTTKTLRLDFEADSASATVGLRSGFTTNSSQDTYLQVLIYGVTDTSSSVPVQVAFYAYSSANRDTTTSGKLPFDTALQNVGNAYDTSSYTFTAPYQGAYYMYFTLFVNQAGFTVDARATMWWKSGPTTTMVTHVHARDDCTTISGSAVLVMTAGDTVWIENSNMQVYMALGHSYFGGYFVSIQNVLKESAVLYTANNLSDVQSSATARANLGLESTTTNLVLGALNTTNNLRINNALFEYTADGAARLGNQALVSGGTLGTKFALWQSTTGETVLNTAAATALQFKVGNVEFMRASTIGNVGINESTPTARLQVGYHVATASAGPDTNAVYVYNSNLTATPISVAIRSANAGQKYVSFDQSGVTGWSIGQDSGDGNKFKIANRWNDLATNTMMTITTAGNVGINQSSPTARLQVGYHVATPSTGPDTNAVYIYNSNLTATPISVGIRSANAGQKYVSFSQVGVAGWTIGQDGIDANKFKICNNWDALVSTCIAITTNKNVGINTSTPAYALDVSGEIRATQNITAYSDARVKTDLQIIPDAIGKVCSLTGYTYTRTDLPAGTPRFTGLVAQDVQRVLPEAVSTDDRGYLGIVYGNLAGMFVEAIKDLRGSIDALATRVATIEDKQQEQEKR